MNCFPCFQSQRSKKAKEDQGPNEAKANETKQETKQGGEGMERVYNINIAAKAFTFRELATATKNFRQECLLGEGGFGRVFRGVLASTGQVVAIKQLDRNGLQGNNKNFLDEVSLLGQLNHPNLVNLIGYCADGDQRLLVFEFTSGGSLEDHLLDITPAKKPLDWCTRIKIAFGAAKGLEHLHCKANPPIVCQNIKPSNILLDEDFNPKVADFGLSKFSPSSGDNKLFGPSRAMGTYGYSAPEYLRGDDLTLASDVYTYGVILLQLITGRKAMDTTRPNDEQNLVTWAQPIFREPKRFPDMADPLLQKQFPEKDLNQAVAIAAMCLQEEPTARPMMSDVVTTLSFLWLTAQRYVPPPLPPSTPPSNKVHIDQDQSKTAEVDHGHISDSRSTGLDNKGANSEGYRNQDSERNGQTSFDNDDDSSDYEDNTGEEEEEEEDDEDDDDDEEYDSSEDEDHKTATAESKKLHKVSKRLEGKSRKSRKGSARLSDNSSNCSHDDKDGELKSQKKSSKHRSSSKRSHNKSNGYQSCSSGKTGNENDSLSSMSSTRSRIRSSPFNDINSSNKSDESTLSFHSASFRSGDDGSN